MAEFIGYLVAFILVYGIPWMIHKNNENIEAKRNAEEFMEKHFGKNYKDKLNR